LKTHFKNYLNLILYFSVYIVAILLAATLCLCLQLPSKYYEIAGCCAGFLTIIVCIRIMKAKNDNIFINWNLRNLKLLNVIFLVFIVLSFHIYTSYLWYITNLYKKINTVSYIGQFFSNNLLINILLFFIIGPVLDETFFRGIIFNELKNKTPIAFAIIIQAILFSIFHNILFFIPYFLEGILLAIIYLWFKTIWAPIIANIILCIDLFLHLPGLLITSISKYYFGLPLAIINLVLLMVSLMLICKNKDKIFYTNLYKS
jgi:uncharacterized protein